MLTFKNKTGMTIIEILIVVAIIALLVSMVLGIATSIQDQANEQLTMETINLLEGALEEYYEYLTAFPQISGADAITNSEDLYEALGSVSASMEVLQRIDNTLIFDSDDDGILEIYDAWRQVPIDYEYVPGNTFPRLVSAGADMVFSPLDQTSDDLRNR